MKVNRQFWGLKMFTNLYIQTQYSIYIQYFKIIEYSELVSSYIPLKSIFTSSYDNKTEMGVKNNTDTKTGPQKEDAWIVLSPPALLAVLQTRCLLLGDLCDTIEDKHTRIW